MKPLLGPDFFSDLIKRQLHQAAPAQANTMQETVFRRFKGKENLTRDGWTMNNKNTPCAALPVFEYVLFSSFLIFSSNSFPLFFSFYFDIK